MIKVILEVITYLLALYGISMLLSNIASSILQKVNLKDPGVRLVLLVKNSEDVIEDIIRSILATDIIKKITKRQKFFVIDMGSTDDTPGILLKLKSDCGDFEVLMENEKEKIFEGYEKMPPVLMIEAEGKLRP